MSNYGKEYVDRGMVKWQGMFLSEQTERIREMEYARNNPIKPKTEMTTEEIDNVLKEAQLHNRPVSIQTQDRDLNGNYYPDVVGGILGYDEIGIYVGNQKVGFDEIRHVEIYESLKWFDV